jgi:hypothetical protein
MAPVGLPKPYCIFFVCKNVRLLVPISAVCWLLTLGESQNVISPWQIGFSAGLNIPAYRSSQKVDKAVPIPGFTGGIGSRYTLTPRLSLTTGLYFTQRNSAYTFTETYPGDTSVGAFRDTYLVHTRQNGRLDMAHLEIPLLVEWAFLKGPQYEGHLTFGLQAGYQLFYRLYGDIEVSLEGLDFLPLFGFSPQTRLIVARGPLEKQSIDITRGDFGLMLGGGNRFQMNKHWMSFDIRYYHGLIDIFKKPPGTRFYNGSISFLLGYWL